MFPPEFFKGLYNILEKLEKMENMEKSFCRKRAGIRRVCRRRAYFR
jgi:hypothetical protein